MLRAPVSRPVGVIKTRLPSAASSNTASRFSAQTRANCSGVSRSSGGNRSGRGHRRQRWLPVQQGWRRGTTPQPRGSFQDKPLKRGEGLPIPCNASRSQSPGVRGPTRLSRDGDSGGITPCRGTLPSCAHFGSEQAPSKRAGSRRLHGIIQESAHTIDC